MKRFHHRLLVLCALVLMFALAASLSPAAYAEYPHLRGNKGLKADTEVTQSAQTPEPEAPVGCCCRSRKCRTGRLCCYG